MKVGIRAAVWMSLAVPAVSLAVPAIGQTTGVSHPDETPITTTPETIQQPVYQPAPVLKTRPVPSTEPTNAGFENKPVMTATARTSQTLADDEKLVGEADVDAGIVTRVAGPANQLPAGTLVKVKINEGLSTRMTAVGMIFTAELTDPVLRDERVLLPAGSTLTGKVTEVHGGKRVSGAASIHLTTESVTLPDGTVYALHAQVADTDLYKSTAIDDEGSIVRRDHKLETLGAMTLSTGSAAAAGAVFGGWPGALVGAAVGAGVSTAVWLKQDRQEEVPAGTKISFVLTSPVVVGAR